jgi:transcriptional regulator with XRE-family HTH domain
MARHKLTDSDKQLRQRIAAHVRRLMHERGWKQSELADALGVSGALVSGLMNGGRMPGLQVVARLHRNLGVDVNELLDVDPPVWFFDPSSNPIDCTAKELEAVSAGEGVSREVAARLEKMAADLRRLGRPRGS